LWRGRNACISPFLAVKGVGTGKRREQLSAVSTHGMGEEFLGSLFFKNLGRSPLPVSSLCEDGPGCRAASDVQFPAIACHGVHGAVVADLAHVVPLRATRITVYVPRFIVWALNTSP